MRIEIIPQDFIVNATMECMGTLQSDLAVKSVRIKNDGSSPVTIKEISYEAFAWDKIIKTISYNEEALGHYIDSFPGKVKWRDSWNNQVLLGRKRFWEYDENPKWPMKII